MNLLTNVIVFAFAIFKIAECNEEMEAIIKKATEAHQACVAEYEITDFQIAMLAMLQIPQDRPAQCYLACVAQKIGAMGTDNKFNENDIRELAAPLVDDLVKEGRYDIATDIVTKCVAEQTTDDDKCVAAKNAMECVVKYAQQAGVA